MIALPDVMHYYALKAEYNKLSSFIRSLEYHYRFEGYTNISHVLKEMEKMEKRITKIIMQMDAFEQSLQEERKSKIESE